VRIAYSLQEVAVEGGKNEEEREEGKKVSERIEKNRFAIATHVQETLGR